jgi:PAS domain S-box-containing protein
MSPAAARPICVLRNPIQDHGFSRGGSIRESFKGLNDTADADELRGRIALLEQRIDDLEESEERYRALIDNAFEGILAVDEEGRANFVNKRMAEILGYEPSEIMGRPISEFVVDKEKARVGELISKSSVPGAIVYDVELSGKSGKVVKTRVTASVLLDRNGWFIGTVALVSDVTERKRIEEALIESEQRFRVLSESTFEGIVVHSDGIVLDVN